MENQPPSELEPLPLWRRILFGVVLPWALLHVGATWYVKIGVWEQAQKKSTPGWGVTASDILIPLTVFGFLSVIFAPLILLVTVRFAFIGWKHWWSALLGGLSAVGIGVALGVAVLLLLRALS